LAMAPLQERLFSDEMDLHHYGTKLAYYARAMSKVSRLQLRVRQVIRLPSQPLGAGSVVGLSGLKNA
jgi:hypothetical protein